VASLTVQAIEISAMKKDGVGRGRTVWSRWCGVGRFLPCLEKWSQTPCLAHRRFLEWSVKVTQQAVTLDSCHRTVLSEEIGRAQSRRQPENHDEAF
jgi:hypothetical protein